jgi:hypothetical protein
VAVATTVIVPALVGLNLSGTGGTAVRWITFALSLVAALLTAVLTLFRFGDRWLMYRDLYDELIGSGWALVNSNPGSDKDEAWNAFVAATNSTIARYNVEYAAEVIAGAQKKQDTDTSTGA